jgi:hypothetical protein
VDSISALTAGSLALVGILWTRNLDQHLLIRISVGLRDLISAESISRQDAYAVAGVVGLVISTSLLLLLIRVRMKGSWVISAECLMA